MQHPSSQLTPAAVWSRVSTDDQRQHTGNQVPTVQLFAAHHGYAIARTFEVDDSAWKGGEGAP